MFNEYIEEDNTLVLDDIKKDMSKLASFLSCNTHIKKLSLRSCSLGKKDAEDLASGKLINLTSLDLYDNKISDEGAKALANSNLSNLTSLNLCSNKIGDEGVKALIKALRNGKFPKLTRLCEQNFREAI